MAVFVYAMAFLPGFAWLYFFTDEDSHPEPKSLLAFTFILGGVFTLLALMVQLYMRDSGFISYLNGLSGFFSQEGIGFPALLVMAFTEELAKFAAAYFSVYRSRYFDEPIDAMIYAVVAALGFATAENLAILHGSFSDQALLANVLGITSVRFIGATLLHALSAAFMGYYWATAMRKNSVRYIFFGLAVATILHGGFNYLILNHENMVFALVLLIIAGFFALGDFEELKSES